MTKAAGRKRKARGGEVAAPEEVAAAEGRGPRSEQDAQAVRDDPFSRHLAKSGVALERMGQAKAHREREARWIRVGRPEASSKPRKLNYFASELQGEGSFEAQGGMVASCSKLSDYAVKERLVRHWEGIHATGGFADADQEALFHSIHHYKDVLHCDRQVPAPGSGDGITDAVVLHCLNHVMRTADLVKAGNAAEARRAEGGADEEPSRDQGFHRPKVLVVLPFKKFAFAWVMRMLALLMHPKFSTKHLRSVAGGNQFLDEYGDPAAGGEAGAAGEAGGQRRKGPSAGKPADHVSLFAGDTGDHFRIGVKLTKSSCKLYSDFYKSDVILTSPLGLVTLMNDKERGEAEGDKCAFLSSIEVLCVDFAQVLLMQNWEHVLTVAASANELPSSAEKAADIMRVREWYLDGQARRFRQTICLTAFPSAETNALMGSLVNDQGMVKVAPRALGADGVLPRVAPEIKQLYLRHAPPEGIEDEADSRFQHFQDTVLSKVLASYSPGVLIFVRSYFDFVRLRRHLERAEASFVALSEYMDRSQQDRAKSHFGKGACRIMLYTERAHFYFRHRIKGVRDVVFYSLPDHCHYFAEVLEMIEPGQVQPPTCTVTYTRRDALQLGRVVGAKRARQMIGAQADSCLLAT